MSANNAPVLANLDGDVINTTSGATILLDAGSNVVLTDDDPFYLVLHRNNTSADDHFGIRTEGTTITLSDGLNLGSVVSLNGTAIADITAATSAWHLEFHFHNGTTAAQVETLLKALTYTAGTVSTALTNDITIYLEDRASQGIFSTVTVNVAPTVTNVAPTIAVDPAKVLMAAVDTGSPVNPFGGLSFADAEENVLTVTISFDASHGKLVVPVGLQAPGFEERNGKKIYTFTGKADALAIIMDVLQFDAVERPLAQVGSHHVTTFTIGVTDADHATPAETFVQVDTTVTNRAPTDIGLSGSTVAEITGGEIGVLSAADQFGAEFTYELIDTAGGRFSLVSGADATGKTVTKVISANGLLLDHEQARSHTIAVKVTDKEGASFIKTFAINVGDVSAENIFGSAGNDIFVGGAGRDTIRGSNGNDELTGGTGKDIFVFNTKPQAKTNKDLIKDWNYRDDTIQLENAIFKALKKTGTLKKAYFTLGSGAKDGNDYVGYNRGTGDLWYDANGNKAGGHVVFANIGKNKTIFHADFAII